MLDIDKISRVTDLVDYGTTRYCRADMIDGEKIYVIVTYGNIDNFGCYQEVDEKIAKWLRSIDR